MSHEWEYVAEDTERLWIPGGWLYRTWIETPAIAVAFVADPTHEHEIPASVPDEDPAVELTGDDRPF